jgi:hypothetical protein
MCGICHSGWSRIFLCILPLYQRGTEWDFLNESILHKISPFPSLPKRGIFKSMRNGKNIPTNSKLRRIQDRLILFLQKIYTLSQGREDIRSHVSLSISSTYSSTVYVLLQFMQYRVTPLQEKTSFILLPHFLHFMLLV